MDIKKIGMAILGIIAVAFGLMKGTDVLPTTEDGQTQQMIEQSVEQETSSTQIVEFETTSSEEEMKDNDAKPSKEETKDSETTVTPEPKKENKKTTKPKSNTDDSKPGNQRLTYEGKDLILTHHAKCRMGCRKISKAEVAEVIEEGKVNKRKSNPNDPRCPTIALEDWTKDGQLVRVIIADCDNVAKLVTVIDLKNNYQCDCK